ncbi:MAG: MBOAT family protein [Lachnospiraceae bacterium]|nr:MBOAT family protein [Lachnospiraceae bacterium]
MVFSSIPFLLYFLPVVLIGYYILSFSRVLQNIFLLVASLFFYAWGEPFYVVLLIGSIIVNYIFGMIIGRIREKHEYEDTTAAKVLLVITIIFNIAMLGFFKYTDFAVEILNNIAGSEWIKAPGIKLPIGISFYTFQALSYVIDVYRGDASRQKNPFNLALYISFFPQLIAGPIVRYTSVEDQIKHRRPSWNMFVSGVCRFSEGLLKKVLLADNLAIVTDNIFALSTYGIDTVKVPVLVSWLGAFAYMFQIYYDFSAYSDMAIGLGRMFGFEFDENFRYPFISKSMREFMTRWHISLAAWFSQYVYKPLGGSKDENKDKMIRNLFIVWLLTGIWHGAAWTFVLWGLYYFVFILFETIFQLDKKEGFDFLRHVYVIVAVAISMVIFRSDSNEQLVLYVREMFGLAHNGFYSPWLVMYLKEFGLVFVAAIICALPVKDYFRDWIEDKPIGKALAVGAKFIYVTAIPVLLIFCIATFAKGTYSPFIYFNF